MKGVLTAAKLMVSWQSLQRWTLAVGMVLLLLATGLGFAGIGIGGLSHWALIMMGVILVWAPPSLVLGLALRAFSAPRTVQLIPHGRAQLLAAAMLVSLVLALFVVLFVEFNILLQSWRAPLSRIHNPSWYSVLLWALMLQTVMFFTFFFGSASTYAWIGIMFLANLPRIAGDSLHVDFRPLLGSVPVCLGFVTISWSLFGAWYLRARKISPLRLNNDGWRGSNPMGFFGGASKRFTVSPRSAVSAYLVGAPSLFRVALRHSVIWLLFMLIVSVPFLHEPAEQRDGLVKALLISVFLPLGVIVLTSTSSALRRSRMLWLAGMGREQLFRQCEERGWRLAIAFGVLMTLFFLSVLWATNSHVNWGYLVLSIPAAVACSIYVGLIPVAGWRTPEVLCALCVMGVVWGAGVLWPLVAETAFTWPRLCLLSSEVATALALRAWARERWRHIDWLQCRIPRGASRLRRTGG